MYQIKFGEYESHTDWDLRCQSDLLASALPRVSYLTVNGMDGSYNMTEVINGRTVYQDRLLTAVFISPVADEADFDALCSTIDQTLDGRTMKITRDSDPDHYLMGEVSTASVFSGTIGTHTITATCRPYRYCNDITEQTVTIDGETTAAFENQEMIATPTFTTTSTDMAVQFGNGEYDIVAGGCTIPAIYFAPGETELTFTGSGTVVVSWQEGVR